MQDNFSSRPLRRDVDVLILGAGCAGTSLAAHLESLGYRGSVSLLDARTDFRAEARWCSWSPQARIVSPVVTRRWNRWQVCTSDGAATRLANSGSDQYAYEEIYAPDFYAHFHENWRSENAEAKIQLHLGQTIESVEASADGVSVWANGQEWRARRVFDARGGGVVPAKQLDKLGHIHLRQTFVGRVVEFERNVFDATTATLMDFRVPQGASAGAGVRFAYVLPQCRRRALIETTVFSTEPMSYAQHDELLREYIAGQFGHDHHIVGEERGDLPMASAPIDPQIGPNWRAIGLAGGAARPSSGYAFGRIQRETEAIACALAHGAALPTPDVCRGGRANARKYAMMDEIFLEAIDKSPEFATECFMRLFGQVSPGALVRFLSETSTLTDDAEIIAALPKTAFLRATCARTAARARALPQSLPTSAFPSWLPIPSFNAMPRQPKALPNPTAR